MGHPKKWCQKSITHARACKSTKQSGYVSPLANRFTADDNSNIEILEYTPGSIPAVGEDNNEFTRWTGGINHDLEMDGSNFSWEDIQYL
jgi:hypothetical protein